jgi:sulfur-carrier protein adenylyltransferase/sulfurtransferase
VLAARDAGAVLLDVREPVETATGVIPGSVLAPLADVLASPDRFASGSVVVVCAVGGRAPRAAVALRAAGADAAVLAGGIGAWPYAVVTV